VSLSSPDGVDSIRTLAREHPFRVEPAQSHRGASAQHGCRDSTQQEHVMDTNANPSQSASRASGDSISAHLQALADEAQALLKATARAGDAQVESARTRLADELEQLRARLMQLEGQAERQVRIAAHRTDETVHAHPYGAMGAAAAVGLLLGFVLGRR
jgi:ElaB/YqjD/DUF883 family membrane-anchored ribosome-binding protein